MQFRWMRYSVHVSWLIAVGCVGFVVGVWLVAYWVNSQWWLLVTGVMGISCALLRKRVYTTPLMFGGLLLLGIWYGSQSQKDLAVYVSFYGTLLQVAGKIKEDPVINESGQLVVQLDQIELSGHELAGTVWLSVTGRPEVKRGDEMTVEGVFDEGFGTFAGSLYRAKVIAIRHPSPGDLGRVVRDWFADGVREAIPEPQASLGIGYLTGQKSALPSDLSEALQIAGLTHIVVASGYNLTILVRLSRRLFMRVSKFVSATATSVMIACFMAVTGLSPSMTRAGLVSGLSLVTWYYGRRFHPFVLLPFAAAITVLWQPSYVWGDLGWQLSFSAFAGVMVVAPLLQRFFFGDEKPSTLRQILGETVSAHIVTIPIIVMSFGVISNVAIPANLAIVPLVPIAMLMTFISGIIGLTVPGVAEILALPASWLLTYMTTTAEYLAGLSWAQTQLELQWWQTVLYYLILIAGCVVIRRVTKLDLRAANIIE